MKQRELPFQNRQSRKPKETENRHQKTSRKLVLFSLSQIPANSCLHKYIYNRKISSRKAPNTSDPAIDRASESHKGPKTQETNNPLREEDDDDDDDDDDKTTTTSTKAHSFT
jgi:hypothetical protein